MKELKLFKSFRELKSYEESYSLSEDQVNNCILELEDFCFQLQNTIEINKLSFLDNELQKDGE
jgi:hypothetical protein